MQITPIIPQPVTSNLPAADPTTTANNRALQAAVKLLNENGAAGSSRTFSLTIDPTTRQVVVRIVNSETHELIDQFPSEYLLELARNFRK